MQRAAVVMFLLSMLGLVTGCWPKEKGAAQDGSKDAKTKDAKVEDGGSKSDITISATELYEAYKSDPKAADQKYKGKRLAVTGKVGTRDNNPKNFPKMILFGLKGSEEKNEYVACYFTWNSEKFFHRLDAKPQPPIFGTCQGAATSEYGKKGARPMEVRLTDCVIPEVAGTKSPYDKGFADGKATGTTHMREIKLNVKAGQDTIRKMIKTYSELHETLAANMRPGGTWPSAVDEAQGRLDGYRKATEASGVK